MEKYEKFLNIIKLKFAEIITEADNNENKWFELFVDEGEVTGTYTIDTGSTFDEAVTNYKKHINQFGINNIFLDLWTDFGASSAPEILLSFWKPEDIDQMVIE